MLHPAQTAFRLRSHVNAHAEFSEALSAALRDPDLSYDPRILAALMTQAASELEGQSVPGSLARLVTLLQD